MSSDLGGAAGERPDRPQDRVYHPAPGPLPVAVDRDRFLDLATYLLEDLVGAGVSAVRVETRRDGERAVAGIAGEGGGDLSGGSGQEFLAGLTGQAGGRGSRSRSRPPAERTPGHGGYR